MGIVNDFKTGQAGEQQVIDLYEGLGFYSWGNPSRKVKDLAKWDIGADNEQLRFFTEVKNDVYAEKSGNIAIEVYNPKSGKPSGIYVTEAEVWCHITDGLYFTGVTRLKQYVESTTPFKIIDRAGDGNATIYLFKKHVLFPSIFERLDNRDSEEALDILSGIIDSERKS